MQIPSRTTTPVDQLGRVCTGLCARYLPWESYRIDRKSYTGHRARCKDCMRAETENVHGDGLSICFVCNREVSPYEHLNQSIMCSRCAHLDEHVYGYPAKVYVILDDPRKDFQGGHFTKGDFICSLEGGVWNSGSIVELWEEYRYKGTFMVAGTMLLPIESAPKGDGVWFFPNDQRSPSQRAGSRHKPERYVSAGMPSRVHMPPLPTPMRKENDV